MAEYTAYFNGEWMPFNEVKISPLDRGFEVGDVVFDVARTFDGKSFRMKEHVDRLYRSLKFVRIDPGQSFDEFMQISEEAIARNEPLREDVGDFTVRQFVTRGEGGWTHQAGPPAVCVMVRPINFGRFSKYYTEGAHGVIPRTRSYSSESLDPKVKHYSRMNFVLANLEAADVDPDAYPVLLDGDGNIAEHIAGNFYLVSNGVLKMPGDRSSLQGDTRKVILELAKRLDIPTSEEELQPYDAYTADEIFLTNTTYCILPAGRVDNRPVGDEVPGPITRQLQAAWSEMVGIDYVDQVLNFRPVA